MEKSEGKKSLERKVLDEISKMQIKPPSNNGTPY